MHTQKILTSARRLAMAVMIALTLAAAPAVQAAPLPVSPFPIDLQTWLNAVNGDAAAITAINTQLASATVYGTDQQPNPLQTYDAFMNPTPPILDPVSVPIENDNPMTFADIIADPTLPPEFLDVVLLTDAVAGDEAALATLQSVLPAAPTTPPAGPLSAPGFDHGVANSYLFKIAAGITTNGSALNTLLLAMQGDAQAINTLRGMLGDTYSISIDNLNASLGCGDTTQDPTAAAFAQNVVQQAAAGDPESIMLIQAILHEMMTEAPSEFVTVGNSFYYDIVGTYDPQVTPPPLAPCVEAAQGDPGDQMTMDDLTPEILDLLEQMGIDPQEWLDQQNAINSGNFGWTASGDEPFEVPDDPPGPEDNDDCEKDDKATLLEDDFDNRDPCTWTRDNKNLEYAQEHQAGFLAVKYLSEWWAEKYLPALRGMTAQLHASYINQTLMFGQLLDAMVLSKAKEAITQREQEQIRRMMPNQQTCVAASQVVAKARASKSASDLNDAAVKGVAGRSGGAAGTTAERGTLGDRVARFHRYCKYFLNPQSNAGQWAGVCPTANAGPLVDADINIEGFLFKDTIDMNNENERNAALAILENLVEPQVHQPLAPSAINTVEGQEEIMKREHMKAMRSVPASVVASIISRRSAIPGAGAGNRVRDIRLRAGVPASRIATNPSYNEIMQAMTKERFFAPDYYAHIAEDDGALKQEQTSVKSYIALQMQDIQILQEQINALMAVRASIKLERMKLDPADSEATNRPQ